MCKIHKFIQSSIKQNLSYCSKCSCLCYKNSPAIIPSFLNENYIFRMDPFLFNIKHVQKNIELNNILNLTNYLKIRYKGIQQIKKIIMAFSMNKYIYYKAVNYLDSIYLNNNNNNAIKTNISILNNLSINNNNNNINNNLNYYGLFNYSIEVISSVCVLIAFEFNECCTKNDGKINIKGFSSFYKNFSNLIEVQTLILKKLNYNLGEFNCFDYINLFFSYGIIFNNNNNNKNNTININKNYQECLFLLENFIEDCNYLKYSDYEIAVSIIKYVFRNYEYFNEKIFDEIYNINNKNDIYNKCQFEINLLLSKFISMIYFNNNKNNFIINYEGKSICNSNFNVFYYNNYICFNQKNLFNCYFHQIEKL